MASRNSSKNWKRRWKHFTWAAMARQNWTRRPLRRKAKGEPVCLMPNVPTYLLHVLFFDNTKSSYSLLSLFLFLYLVRPHSWRIVLFCLSGRKKKTNDRKRGHKSEENGDAKTGDNVDDDDIMGPKPMLPYSSMFILSPTNP